ncbi:MAG: DNA-directed RNA polymerase subunit omega [Nitrospirae bacterium]|nr:DNA-directed RNA polymerase subunit omega [Nitrospirota bacterium]
MDILSLPIEIEDSKIDSRFRLVIITSQRAKTLSEGVKALITTKYKKNTTIALEESVLEKLDYLTGEGAVKAKEIAKKLEFKKKVTAIAKKEGKEEELSELEKDLKVYLLEKAETEKRKEDIFGERGE